SRRKLREPHQGDEHVGTVLVIDHGSQLQLCAEKLGVVQRATHADQPVAGAVLIARNHFWRGWATDFRAAEPAGPRRRGGRKLLYPRSSRRRNCPRPELGGNAPAYSYLAGNFDRGQ